MLIHFNMKKGSLILLTAITCIAVSCTKSHPPLGYTEYRTFPEEKMLTAEVLPVDSGMFRYPFRICVKDNMLILLDLHNTDYYLHAFTYPKMEFITSFGHRGEAPEDLLSIETFIFNSPDSIWVLDSSKQQITRWKISSQNRTAERVEEIGLDKDIVRGLDFVKVGSSFVIPDYMGNYRINTIDMQGKIIQREGDIPTVKHANNKRISRPALSQAWRSFMGYNPNKQILVLGTQLGEVIEIRHLNDSTQNVILYGPNGEPQFKESGGYGIPIGIMGFNNIQITDNYIYATFNGTTFKEIIAKFQKGENSENGCKYIYVFDLKGNPIRKYTLDCSIGCLYVNEKEGYILGADMESDEPIVKFKL